MQSSSKTTTDPTILWLSDLVSFFDVLEDGLDLRTSDQQKTQGWFLMHDFIRPSCLFCLMAQS